MPATPKPTITTIISIVLLALTASLILGGLLPAAMDKEAAYNRDRLCGYYGAELNKNAALHNQKPPCR